MKSAIMILNLQCLKTHSSCYLLKVVRWVSRAHGANIPDCIQVKEDFFPDQRSYFSELWSFDHTTNVTYYFCAEDIPNDKDAIEKYLISMNKLNDDEDHELGICVFDREDVEIYSVTVTVGIDDELLCKDYM